MLANRTPPDSRPRMDSHASERAALRGTGRSGSVRGVTTEPQSSPHDAAAPAPSAPARERFGALQQRDFRLLWMGLVVAHIGSWMQQVTQNWLLWELTHSPMSLGLYGLCRSLPFITVSLYAGAIADRLDRRWLIIVTNGVNTLFPLALGIIVALGRVEPWHIYLAGGWPPSSTASTARHARPSSPRSCRAAS